MHPEGLPLPDGLSLRPATSADRSFLDALRHPGHGGARQHADAEDIIEALTAPQQYAQNNGRGARFPDAYYFVVERHGERVGRLVIDFGPNEVRLIDIAFIPAARSHGYGKQLLNALQHAAACVQAPLTLTVRRDNLRARALYESLGFRVEQSDSHLQLLAWRAEHCDTRH
jgi:ribosomal protein S18 acetylase RimI-like enzyme